VIVDENVMTSTDMEVLLIEALFIKMNSEVCKASSSCREGKNHLSK
jgi:hypothetical protein